MRVALVRIIRGDVENVIVADDKTDYPPRGYALVQLSDSDPVSAGYQWDGKDGFVPPRKIVAIDDKKIVVRVEEFKHYDEAPDIRGTEFAETFLVDHNEAVEVGSNMADDGSFTPPDAAAANPAKKV